MKKNILITGANSYVGTNVEKWLLKEPDTYHVETLDMKDPNWKAFYFTKFDVVFHVAGIAHLKETKMNKELYYKVNRDLAVEVAKLSKESNVKQFVFMSSMSVYGVDTGVINKNSVLNPKTAYGKSKLEAERIISDLQTNSFIVSILRPPMIYGIGSPGNYKKLSKLALKLRFFPNTKNRRSMLHIQNLCIAVESIIKDKNSGVFNPSNFEDVNTYEFVQTIRSWHNKKTSNFLLVIPFIKLIGKINGVFSKVFDSLYYDASTKYTSKDYVNLNDSIKLTETNNE